MRRVLAFICRIHAVGHRSVAGRLAARGYMGLLAEQEQNNRSPGILLRGDGPFELGLRLKMGCNKPTDCPRNAQPTTAGCFHNSEIRW